MIDRVDRAVRLITEAIRQLLPPGRFDVQERPAVGLKGKEVQVGLWAPRAHKPSTSIRDHAGASVPD